MLAFSAMKMVAATPRSRAASATPLRVVPSACGGDSSSPFVRRELREPVVRAAYLKRAGALLVLALQHDICARPDAPGGAVTRDDRRVVRDGLDAGQSGFNRGKRDIHRSYHTSAAKKSQGEGTQAAKPVDFGPAAGV